MKELLLYMAKNLVDNPDAVSVTEISEEDGLVLELRVAPEDMGKVIGRQGRIAKEIRTIIKTVAQRDGEKVTVEIVDLRVCVANNRHAFLVSRAGPGANSSLVHCAERKSSKTPRLFASFRSAYRTEI